MGSSRACVFTCLFLTIMLISLALSILLATGSLVETNTGRLFEKEGIAIIAEPHATEVHLYLWTGHDYIVDVTIEKIIYHTTSKVYPPLHELALDTENLEQNVNQYALKLIEVMNFLTSDEPKKSKIPVAFAGTSGMYRLASSNNSKALAIVESLKRALDQSEYQILDNTFGIIDGKKEGILQWFTSNLLTFLVNPADGTIYWTSVLAIKSTSLVLGSAPIAYGSGYQLDSSLVSQYELYDSKITLYGNSFDCLGSETSYFYFLKYLIFNTEPDAQNRRENPCAPQGDSYIINSNFLQYQCIDGTLPPLPTIPLSQDYTFVGTSNPQLCLNITEQMIPPSICGGYGCRVGNATLPVFTPIDHFNLYGQFAQISEELSLPVGYSQLLNHYTTRCSRPSVAATEASMEFDRRICFQGAMMISMFHSFGINVQQFGGVALNPHSQAEREIGPGIGFGLLINGLGQLPQRFQYFSPGKLETYVVVMLLFTVAIAAFFLVILFGAFAYKILHKETRLKSLSM